MSSFNATTTSSRRYGQSRRQRRNRRISDRPIRGIFNILTDSKKEAAEYHAKVDRYFAIWRERTACQVISEEELAEIRARVDSAEMYQRVCNNLFNLLSTCLENKDYAILAFDLMTQLLALRKFVRDNPVPDLENEPTTYSDEDEYFDQLKTMDDEIDATDAESLSSGSSTNIDEDNRSYTSTERELLSNYYRYRPSCYDSDNSGDQGTCSYSEQERRLVKRLVRRDTRRQRTMTLLNNMSNSEELSAIDEERADIARQRRQLLAEREILSREIEELRRQREEMELEEQLRSEEEEVATENVPADEEPRRLTREALEEHERMQQQRYNLRTRNTNVRYSESVLSEYTVHNASTVAYDADEQGTTTNYFDDIISVSDEEMEETDELLPALEHSAKEYAPGKTLVTIKNMRLCNRMDERTADKNLNGLQWPVEVLPGIDEEQEDLDRRYFCEMTNNANCSSQTLTNEELNDPLTLAAAMLRECPLCTKEKAGFNIVYTRTCQHHMCRKCLLKLAIVARREKRDITCPICRTQINEIFGFTRGQGKRGRMAFYSCVPTPCSFQSM